MEHSIPNEIVQIPTIKIQPNKCVCFNTYDYEGHQISFSRRNSKLPALSGSRPHVSDRSAKKIRTACDYLSITSGNKTVYDSSLSKAVRFRLSFFTLTLCSYQIHSDLELKSKLINQFIVEIKRHYNVVHYVWRMEKQLNNNTHFHFLTNKFIPCHELRHLWNRIQNKLGYVDRYRESMLKIQKGGYASYLAKTGRMKDASSLAAFKSGIKSDWMQPNSTDIKAILHVKNISAYLSKYMSKNEKLQTKHTFKSNSPIGDSYSPCHPSVSPNALRSLRKLVARGRLYGTSQGLSKANGTTEMIDRNISNELELIRNHKDTFIIDEKFYSVFCYTPQILLELNCTSLFNHLLNGIINSLGVNDYYELKTDSS